MKTSFVSHFFSAIRTLFLFFLLSLTGLVFGQDHIIRVQVGGTGPDGDSWANAFGSVQDAVEHIKLKGWQNDENHIWVAAGNHITGYSGGTNFLIQAGENSIAGSSDFSVLHFYGGFSGTETSLEQREPTIYPTVLDGQGNSRAIFRFNPSGTANRKLVVDGFTITGNNTSTSTGRGAILTDGTTTGNFDVSVSNCVFHSLNVGSQDASVAFIKGNNGVNVDFTNCVFRDIVSSGSTTTGLVKSTKNVQPVQFTNCTFRNINKHGYLFHRTTGTSAGAYVRNCIFDETNNMPLASIGEAPVEFQNNLFTPGTGVNNELDIAVSEVGASISDNVFGGVAGFVDATTNDLSLLSSSGAIDKGNNFWFTNTLYSSFGLPDVDLGGELRLFNSSIDIGAYENISCPEVIFVNSSNASSIQDGFSWSTAFDNIDEAVVLANQCSSSKQIWIKDGNYDISSTQSILEPVQIYGSVLTSSTIGNLMQDYEDATNVVADNSGGGGDFYLFSVQAGVEVSFNRIVFDQGNNELTVGVFVNNASVEIDRCQFENCALMNATVGLGNFIIVKNSVVDGHEFNPYLMEIESSSSGATLDFFNNTVTGFGEGASSPQDLFVFSGTNDFTKKIYNSIFWDNNYDEFINNANPSPVALTNSIIQDNVCPANTSCGMVHFATDPLFHSGISLSACSPAIDAGNNSADFGALDYAEEARSFGGVVDLGAYERQSAFSSPLVVTSNSDLDRCGTLRYALNYAITNPGPDEITFSNIMMGQVIQPTSQLPLISGPNAEGTVINGDIDNDNVPDVEIDGNSASASGIVLMADNCEAKHLSVYGFTNAGVLVNKLTAGNITGIKVLGNYLGTNIAGTSSTTGNSIGVRVLNNTDGVQIGDGTVEGRNHIAGNTSQDIFISNTLNASIQGNYIGTNRAGDAIYGGPGAPINILLSQNSTNCSIGGTTAGEENIIANTGTALQFVNVTNSQVLGNFIGTEATKTMNLSSGNIGVDLRNASGNTFMSNTIANQASIGIMIPDLASNSSFDNDIQENEFLNGESKAIDFTATGVQDNVMKPTFDFTTDGINITLTGTVEENNSLVQVYFDSTGEGEYYHTVLNASGLNWTTTFPATALPTGMDKIRVLVNKGDNTSVFSDAQTICLNPFLVTESTDNNPTGGGECGDLRYAIDAANLNSAVADVITFNLPDNSIIEIMDELPEITTTATIDGSGMGDGSRITVSGTIVTPLEYVFKTIRPFTMNDVSISGNEKVNTLVLVEHVGVTYPTTLTDVNLSGALLEGIKKTVNGELIVTNSAIANNDISGIDIAGDGTVTNCTIGVQNVNATNSQQFGIRKQGGSGDISGNVIANNTDAGVLAIDDLEAGNIINNHFYNNDDGIRTQNIDNLNITSNKVGLNGTGMLGAGFGQRGVGIRVLATAGNLTIQNNAISQASFQGIAINGITGDVLIENNLVGIDSSNANAGNGASGILIASSNPTSFIVKSNRIGFNNTRGIRVSISDNISIEENFIGTNEAGDNLGNVNSGVQISEGATNNLLQNNVIAWNGESGVLLDDATTNANTLSQNNIYANLGKGILLANGANSNRTIPVINGYDGSSFNGTADGPMGTKIELFGDTEDEGRFFLGEDTFGPTPGDWSIAVDLGAIDASIISFTATQTFSESTSEFSLPRALVSTPDAPDNLCLTGGNEQVELSWTEVTGVSNYSVLQTLDTMGGTIITTPVTGLTNTNTGLTNNELYYFAVASENGDTTNWQGVVPVVEAGKALVFDGTNEVDIDNQGTTLTGDLTIEAWIKPSSSTNTRQTIFGHVGGASAPELEIDNSHAWLYLDGGANTLVYSHETGAGINVDVTSAMYAFEEDNWYHVALTRDITTRVINFYVNGELLSSDSYTQDITGGTTNISSIGGLGLIPDNLFNFVGEIDEVRVWEEVRDVATINANKDVPFLDDKTGLFGWWHLDEPTGSTAYDASCNNYNGTYDVSPSPVESKALHPFAVQDLLISAIDNPVTLSWTDLTEDIQEYEIYKGIGSLPDTSGMPDDVTSSLDYTEVLSTCDTVFYVIVGVDENGQVGNISDTVSVFVGNPLVVTSTADDGTCGTLRNAINYVNTNAVAGVTDTIKFDFTGVPQPWVIEVGSSVAFPNTLLPEVTAPVVIDGWSEPSWTSAPVIEIDGSNIISGTLSSGGLEFKTGSDNSTLRGLSVTGFFYGSFDGFGLIVESSDVKVQGNYIGVSLDGSASPNRTGILVSSAVTSGVIGTDNDVTQDDLEGNVISGNTGTGITMNGDNIFIRGNKIGSNPDGTSAVPNATGLDMNQAVSCTVGGLTSTERNLIAYNSAKDFTLSGSSNDNLIIGNYLGANETGVLSAEATESVLIRAINQRNTFGDETEEGQNFIANLITQDNEDGDDLGTGLSPFSNTWNRNTIYGEIRLEPGSQDDITRPVITELRFSDSTVLGASVPGAFVYLYAGNATNNATWYLTRLLSNATTGDWEYKLSEGEYADFAANMLDSLIVTQTAEVGPFVLANSSAFSNRMAVSPCDPLLVKLTSDDPNVCGTLRGAVDYVNANNGGDIKFSFVDPNPVILLDSSLSILVDDVEIDGETFNVVVEGQPGFTYSNPSEEFMLLIGDGNFGAGTEINNLTLRSNGDAVFKGISLNVPAPVTLENCTLDNFKLGIDVLFTSSLTLTSSVINSSRVNPLETIDGVYFNSDGGLTVTDTDFPNMSGNGITVFRSGSSINIRDNRFGEDVAGFIGTPNGIAVNLASNVAGGVVTNNVITGNGIAAITVFDNVNIEISNNTITGGNLGIAMNGTSGLDILTSKMNLSENLISGITGGLPIQQSTNAQFIPKITTVQVPLNQIAGGFEAAVAPGANYTIEIFATADGQADYFVKSQLFASGNTWTITGIDFTVIPSQYTHVTATATFDNNTSPLSVAFPIKICDPFVVTSGLDTDPMGIGVCGDLRYAITEANLVGGNETITFDLPLSTDVISISAALPSITEDGIKISGNVDLNGTPDVILRAQTAQAFDGINIRGQADTIQGLVFQNFNNAITVTNSSQDAVIQNNYMGTDKPGLIAMANSYGVSLASAQRTQVLNNVISGNLENGILINSGSNYLIENNKIGVGSDGTTPLSNRSSGIRFTNSTLTDIKTNIIAYNGSGTIENGRNGIYFSNVSAGALRNSWVDNSIFANVGNGIFFEGASSTVQNSIVPPAISISGTVLSGNARGNAVISVFADSDDQGEFFIGTVTASSGSWTYDLATATGITAGLDFITVIQTDVDNNSSEFSDPVLFNNCDQFISGFLGEDIVTVCQADTIIKSSVESTDYTYLWLSEAVTGNERTVSTAGTYILEIDSSGCKAVDTLILSEFVQDPELGITNSTGASIKCPEENALIEADDKTDGSSIEWVINDELSGETDFDIASQEAGDYYFVKTFSGCRDTSATVTIDDHTVNNDLITEDAFTVCDMDTTLSNAYTWFVSGNATVLTDLVINTDGDYVAQQTDGNNCLASDTVDFSFGGETTFDFELAVTDPGSLCEGITTLTIEVIPEGGTLGAPTFSATRTPVPATGPNTNIVQNDFVISISVSAPAIDDIVTVSTDVDVCGVIQTISKDTVLNSGMCTSQIMAVDDDATVDEGGTVIIDVLTNDVGASPFSINVLTGLEAILMPSKGTISVTDLFSTITYVANPGETGTDEFEYIITDANGDMDTAKVTVTINEVLEVAVDDVVTTDEDVAIVFNVTTNDVLNTVATPVVLLDANYSPLPEGDFLLSLRPDNPTGTFGEVTYTPDPGWFGIESLQYIVLDGLVPVDTGLITVTVNEVINTPPVAVDDATTIEQGAVATIQVNANDTDTDDGLDVTSVDLDLVTAGVQNSISTSEGSWAVDNTGLLTFEPLPAFSGVATIDYTISDIAGNTSNVATITVTVTPTGCPLITIDQSNANICDGTTILTASSLDDISTYSFQWALNNENDLVVGETTESYEVLLQGTYLLIYENPDDATCSGQISETVSYGETKPTISISTTELEADVNGTYQWYVTVEGKKRAIVGANQRNYKYLFTGEYFVEVAHNNCTLISDGVNVATSNGAVFKAGLITTEDEIWIPETSGELVVLPNPSEGEFTGEFSSYSSEVMNVSLLNAQGIEVFRSVQAKTSFKTPLYLGSLELSSGVYFLLVTQGNKQFTERVQVVR